MSHPAGPARAAPASRMDASSTLPVVPAVEAVRESLRRASTGGSAASLYSTLCAATDAVRRALACETAAEHAALSLGHRETLDALCTELGEVERALAQALERFPARPAPVPRADRPRLPVRLRLRAARRAARAPSWWLALAEALQALEQGAERLDALAAGQPPGAPARAVAEATAHLLRDHHARLLRKADRGRAAA